MFQELKKDIKEIIEIVNSCPAPLQQQCFEILLKTYLGEQDIPPHVVKPPLENTLEKPKNTEVTVETTSPAQQEIKLTYFHLAVRRFFESSGITIEDINNIYYLESNRLMPLYDHLGTTRTSDSQIRLALLTAFEKGYSSNDFSFEIESVRERCKSFKCYDTGNFMANFKRNKTLFDGLDESDATSIKLSAEGKKELATIIKELAKIK